MQVLFGVDLEVRRGEMVALLGTNGSGKSTLLRVVSGLLDHTSGRVDVDGRPALVPGGRGIFASLSVADNLRLACWPYRRNSDQAWAATERMLDLFPALRGRRSTPGPVTCPAASSRCSRWPWA